MTKIRNVTVHLGPREVVIGGKVIGTVGNITVDVEESTEGELAALKSAPIILLVKPLPEKIDKEAKRENQKSPGQ